MSRTAVLKALSTFIIAVLSWLLINIFLFLPLSTFPAADLITAEGTIDFYVPRTGRMNIYDQLSYSAGAVFTGFVFFCHSRFLSFASGRHSG